MTVNDFAFIDEPHAVLKHRLIFSRKARDDICADGNFTALRLHSCNDFYSLFARMAPFHALQDEVVPCLEAQVNMRHHPWTPGNQVK